MDLLNKNRVIAWDDENNETRYYVNGIYVGTTYDFMDLVNTAFQYMVIGKEAVSRKILAQDLNEIASQATADKIMNFLGTAEILTIAQEQAIYNYDFEKLAKII